MTLFLKHLWAGLEIGASSSRPENKHVRPIKACQYLALKNNQVLSLIRNVYKKLNLKDKIESCPRSLETDLFWLFSSNLDWSTSIKTLDRKMKLNSSEILESRVDFLVCIFCRSPFQIFLEMSVSSSSCFCLDLESLRLSFKWELVWPLYRSSRKKICLYCFSSAALRK